MTLVQKSLRVSFIESILQVIEPMVVPSHRHCHSEKSLAFFCLLKQHPKASTDLQEQADSSSPVLLGMSLSPAQVSA